MGQSRKTVTYCRNRVTVSSQTPYVRLCHNMIFTPEHEGFPPVLVNAERFQKKKLLINPIGQSIDLVSKVRGRGDHEDRHGYENEGGDVRNGGGYGERRRHFGTLTLSLIEGEVLRKPACCARSSRDR